MAMKKAVIMAGGFGTRLRPLTMSIPKPMVPVANIPMIEHIINLLKKHNITEIVCVLYFQPEKITDYFGDGSKFGVSIEYVLAVADYGTAGAVRNAAEKLNEPFIIISGDVLTDFDISAALKFHEDNGSQATILLTRVPNPLAYGIVMTKENGAITRFLEKPSWGEVFSDTINTGIYILEPEVLQMIPYQQEFDFSKDLYPAMLEQKRPLFGYVTDGYWRDIGNLTEYQIASQDVLQGKVNIDIRGEKHDNVHLGKNVRVAETAVLKGMVVLGDNAVVGENAEILDCIIGSNVTIGERAIITGCVLWDDVKVGAGAIMTNDVVCNGTVIGDETTISENVFIAENCTIGTEAKLLSNIKLWPKKEVESGAVLSRSLVQEEKWLRELFTEARITGISNIEMNPEFGAKLGAAIGNAYGKDVTLVASRDHDPVSRILKRSITAGLTSVGVCVNDLQVTSIPETRMELSSEKFAGGLHVRKSPRQPDKTDIILFGNDGRDMPLAKGKSIERFFFGEDIKRVDYMEVGKLNFPLTTNVEYVNRYLKTLNIDAIAKRFFKIIINYSHGLASTVFPQILGELDCTVLAMNNYIDHVRHAPSTHETGSGEMEKVMTSVTYDVGFHIDPGAERITVVDDKGVRYTPSRLITVVTKLFLEANKHREPYTIAAPVIASDEVEMVAKDYNVNVIRIKNSHSAMMEATRNKDVLFVGGTRGGFIFPEFMFASDGMYSIGKILEMLAVTGLKMSELEGKLPRRAQVQLTAQCPWDLKGKVMRMAMEHSENMERQLIDGVKVFENGNSVLILPDKERAEFLVFAESDDTAAANKLASEYQQRIADWQNA
jgi:mannose-1-phosphate guanylyltransferase/phosphomannomutase